MKLGTFVYIPPPKFSPAPEFYKHIQEFKPVASDLIMYSDHAWPGAIKMGNPEKIRDSSKARWAVNNIVFLTGLRMAKQMGYSHIIYLEIDCRMGTPDWDQRMFEDYFNLGTPMICAGTLVVYNPCNAGREAALRWEQLLSQNTARNMPIATYGFKGAADPHPSCIFPNGALGIYDMQWMNLLWNLEATVQEANLSTAWDMELGARIWKRFGVESYDVCGMIKCIYSGYGEVLTTEAERLMWLREGRYVAVHQVKSKEVI